MPSGIMATLGLDASNFNNGAEKVIAKTQKMKAAVAQTATSRAQAFNPKAGLASDASAFINAEAAAAKKITGKKALADAEKRQAAIEMEEFRRQDQIAKAKQKAERDRLRQEKDLIAQHAALSRQKSNQMKFDAEVAKIQKERNSVFGSQSPLGGAAKMFAGYLTADFAMRKGNETVEYARQLTVLSKQLNVSTDDLQAWEKVVKKNGLTLDDVGKLFEKLNKNRINALQGNEPLQQRAFSELGFSNDMLKTAGASEFGQQLTKAAKTMPAEQFAAALMRVGEESAASFVGAFREGLGDSVEAVKEAGNFMSRETIARFNAIEERWLTGAQSIGGMFTKYVLPPMLSMFEQATNKVDTLMTTFGTAWSFIKGLWDTKSLTGGVESAEKFIQQKMDDDAKRQKKIEDAKKPFEQKPIDLSAVKNQKAEADKKKLQDEVNREIEREMRENAKLGKHSVNSLQQIGGFLGNYAVANSPEIAAMNAQIDSKRILERIDEKMGKILKGDKLPMSPDVSF